MDTLFLYIEKNLTCCQSRAKNLCGGCYSSAEAIAGLTFLGFKQKEEMIKQDSNLPSDENDIEDFANPTIDVDGQLQLSIDFIKSEGYSVKGFITKGTCLNDLDFALVNQQFDTIQADFKIWWHFIIDPIKGDTIFLSKINNYNDYLFIKFPPKEDIFDGSNDEPCKNTKRTARSGSISMNGTVEHWMIEL